MGVAAFVQRLPCAIGYVEWAYAKQNKMAYSALKNASGANVQPKIETFKAAAAGADWSKTFYQILTNEPSQDAWPIVGATFVLLHTTQDKPDHGKETLKFFDWAFKNGNHAAQDLDYITLPDSGKTEIRTQWSSKVKDASGKPVVEWVLTNQEIRFNQRATNLPRITAAVRKVLPCRGTPAAMTRRPGHRRAKFRVQGLRPI